MKGLRLSDRAARQLLIAAGTVVITIGVSGVALAADATSTAAGASAAIKGCFNAQSGALRVLTPHSKTCGSERKISWNQVGPAGNGYAFTSTSGKTNKYQASDSDGPVVTKAGTYFVNVTANLDISAYTSGGQGFCALDLAQGMNPTNYIFEIFSPWEYPNPAADISNAYPFAASGMIHVSAKQAGQQLVLECFDNSFDAVPVKGTWLVSPVAATTSATVSASLGHSTLGAAGFRPKPALR